MQLDGLITITHEHAEHFQSLANMAGESFLEDMWTSTLLDGITKDPTRRLELSRLTLLNDILVGHSVSAVYATPEHDAMMVAFLHSDLRGNRWEDLEAAGFDENIAPHLSEEEVSLWESREKEIAGISLWERPEEIHEDDSDFMHILMFAVDKDKRGNGAASKMMRAFMARADELEVPIYLETFSDRLESLYCHYGFEVIERHWSASCGDVYERIMVRYPR